MNNDVQLPYALRNDKVVYIDDVDSGLHPDCLCQSCGHALVAKKGNIKVHHFAHHRDSDCAYATETALHLAAKQIIEQERQLMLPSVMLKFAGSKPPWELAKAQLVSVDDVRVESRVGVHVPDLVVTVRGHRLAIEVTVTHKTDDEKIRRLSEHGCSILEIDLSEQSRFLSLEELKALVVNGVAQKKWRFNHYSERVRREVEGACERKEFISRGMALHVDDCPIPARVWRGKPYANVIDDCWGCEHCVHNGMSGDFENSSVPLLCLGRSGIVSYEDWRSRRAGN
jgi:hypothetical protein